MKVLFLLFLIFGIWSRAEAAVVFSGQFEPPQVSNAACDGLIDPQVTYKVSHFWAGANGLTSVLNFQTPNASFLNNLSVVGLYDYNNNFEDERTFLRDNREYHVVAEGIVTYQLLVVDLLIEARDPSTRELLCTAKAELSAFQ